MILNSNIFQFISAIILVIYQFLQNNALFFEFCFFHPNIYTTLIKTYYIQNRHFLYLNAKKTKNLQDCFRDHE